VREIAGERGEREQFLSVKTRLFYDMAFSRRRVGWMAIAMAPVRHESFIGRAGFGFSPTGTGSDVH
jgi:hypothetical protein